MPTTRPVCDSTKLAALGKNLDKGFYVGVTTRSREPGICQNVISGYGQIAAMAAEAGLYPTDEEILQRTDALVAYFGNLRAKEADPVTKGVRTWRPNHNEYLHLQRFAEETWALDQMLAMHDIRTKGLGASQVSKFFGTGASAVIFPAWLETQIEASRLAVSLLPAISTLESAVTAHSVEVPYMNDLVTDRQADEVGEGGILPTKEIRIGDNTIQLRKYGMGVRVSYEAIRLQKVDVLGFFIQRAFQQMGIDETDLAIQVSIAGDGNANAAVPIATDVAGTLDYDDLIKWLLGFPAGYQCNIAAAHDGGTAGVAYGLRELANMAEFKDPQAGAVRMVAGIPNPMMMDWRRWTSTGSAGFAADRLVGWDATASLEVLREGGILQETDKLIDQQFSRVFASTWVGCRKIDANACQVLDVV